MMEDSSMRIGIVTLNRGHLGDSVRVQKFHENLRRMGFDVSILNPLSAFTQASEGATSSRFTTTLPRLWRIMSTNPVTGASRFQQFVYNIGSKNLSRTLMKMVQRKGIDLLQAETHMAAQIALPVKRELDIPMFFDVHSGTFVDEVEKMTNCSESFLRFLKTKEDEMMLDSDEIFVVSGLMKSRLESSYGLRNVTLVPNGADPYPNLTKEHGNPLRVVYAGIFSYWERVDDYLDAVKITENGDFKFYIAGDGDLRKHIIKRIRRENLPIEYLGCLPRETLREQLKSMHIGVSPMSNEEARKLCSSMKTFEYLSLGLPVVCADVGEWAETVKENDCGIIVPPEDPRAIAHALKMYEDKDLWTRHSDNGIRLIENEYSWETIISRTKLVYEKYAA